MQTTPDHSNSQASARLSLDALVDSIQDLQNPLLTYITSILGNTRDSDDILQETNLFLIEKSKDFEAGTNFKAWAYKIAYFKALACRRDNLRRDDVAFSEEMTQQLAARAEDFACKQAARLSALSHCLELLPPKDKSLIEQKYLSRISLTEHAAKAGKSANSVHKKISRLRLVLKKCVENSLSTS